MASPMKKVELLVMEENMQNELPTAENNGSMHLAQHKVLQVENSTEVNMKVA